MKLQVLYLKPAGDADPGDVEDVRTDRVEIECALLALGLVDDALGRLQPRRDVLDGAVAVDVSEFLFQDVDLRDQLVDPELVTHHESREIVSQPTQVDRSLTVLHDLVHDHDCPRRQAERARRGNRSLHHCTTDPAPV